MWRVFPHPVHILNHPRIPNRSSVALLQLQLRPLQVNLLIPSFDQWAATPWVATMLVYHSIMSPCRSLFQKGDMVVPLKLADWSWSPNWWNLFLWVKFHHIVANLQTCEKSIPNQEDSSWHTLHRGNLTCHHTGIHNVTHALYMIYVYIKMIIHVLHMSICLYMIYVWIDTIWLYTCLYVSMWREENLNLPKCSNHHLATD